MSGESLATAFFIVAVYLLPTMIAASRGHLNTGAIFVLNLFLGWTLVGWVIAMVWAVMNTQRAANANHRP